MTDIFNLDVKQKYLNQFENPDTKEVYTRVFKKSKELEVEKNKDLCNFNEEELEYFMKEILKPKTKESARTYCNILASYFQWAIDNKSIADCVHITNPLKRRQDYFLEFVAKTKLYINKEEKDFLISSNVLMNKQDSFIIQALWDGIEGKQLSELVNLRVSDLDIDNNKVYIRDINGDLIREIEVEDKTIDYALLANREEEYYKNNGRMDYSEKLKQTFLLPRSNYILKKATVSEKELDKNASPITRFTIQNRLEMVRSLEELKDYSDALTPKNIVRSGMLYKALKLYERDRTFGRKQIEEICKQYNLTYKWSLGKDFLNVETLKELYPEEVEKIEQEIAMEN